MVNKFTIKQVSMHNHREDLWIIVHGNVYDLTSFLMEHPGGEEVLLGLAGQDGTECFDTIGHSDEAKQLREKFKIGEVTNERGTQSQITSAGTTSADEITDVTEPDDQNVEEQKKKVLPQIFIYVTVVVYAIIFYYYYQNM